MPETVYLANKRVGKVVGEYSDVRDLRHLVVTLRQVGNVIYFGSLFSLCETLHSCFPLDEKEG